MKVFAKATVFILSLIFLAGCADLTVTNLDVNWDASNKHAKARIRNIGSRDAGMFMVYFDAEENPVSQNHRPQVCHQVDGLAKGDYVDLEADFSLLAHPDNANLANVYKIVVTADPKHMVKESNENNNSKEMPVP
ncbi:MAG: CARDB domain-containing protein [Planctomycetota bacterium]|jgi:hypothetical protein